MNKVKEALKWVKNNAKMIMQAVVYIVTICNSGLALMGVHLPVENETIYTIVSFIIMAAVFVYGVWSNFSVSKEAKASDKVMRALKQGTLDMEQVKELVETVTDSHTYKQIYSDETEEENK